MRYKRVFRFSLPQQPSFSFSKGNFIFIPLKLDKYYDPSTMKGQNFPLVRIRFKIVYSIKSYMIWINKLSFSWVKVDDVKGKYLLETQN